MVELSMQELQQINGGGFLAYIYNSSGVVVKSAYFDTADQAQRWISNNWSSGYYGNMILL